MRAVYFCIGLWLATGSGWGEKLDPAKWSVELQPASVVPGAKVLAHLQAKIEPGWHLYSLTPTGGPIATTIRVADNPAAGPIRIFQPQPKRSIDPNFNLETETYEGQPAFLIEIETKKDAAAGPSELALEVRYQMCNDRLCLPPVKRRAAGTLTIDAGARPAAFEIPPGYTEFKPGRAAAASVLVKAPVQGAGDSQEFGLFLLTAFGFGLAAIFTPCVFPMIPITMSFFLNRPSGSRAESLT